MSEEKRSYRQVMQATSLFGGVQVVNILISLVRSKVVAVLIGPLGMGIVSLLNSTMGLVNEVTNLGLDRSAVKDISFARENGSEKEISRTIQILKKLVWVTAISGAVLMIVLSPWLSEFAFDNRDFTWSFIWISIALLFNQLTRSRLAILQGLRKLRHLALANVIGNFLSLLVTVPLYYFYGIDAIVPAIIATSFLSLLCVYYYARKISLATEPLSLKQAVTEGRSMVHLGFMLGVSGIITLLVAYVLQIYISQTGGVDQVGLYNVGFLILNTYVGLIFKAMATDYFPRLSGVADKIELVRKTVLEQAYIAVLLITPVIVIFLTFAPYIIRLLFSKEFLPVIALVSWGILGMLFKAVSWSMGYIILSKGDSRIFIRTVIAFSANLLILNILGYYLNGLEGLGISFLVHYIVHFTALTFITKHLYNFYFPAWFYGIFGFCMLLCTGAFFLANLEDPLWKYGTMGLLILISGGFSLYQLNRKLDLKDMIQNRKGKKM